ncbi:hypothetical protein Tco_0124822, partial [Tanacetum coccineum]
MVAKNTKKTPQDSASKQSVHGTKHAPPKKLTPVKPTKPAHVKQTIPPSSKLPKSPKKKPSKNTPSRKVRKGKPSLVRGVAIRERVADEIQRLLDVNGKGNAIVTEGQAAHSLIDLSKKKSTTDQFILQRRNQAPHDSTTGPSSQPLDDTSEKVVHESSSTTNSERTKSETEAIAPKVDKEQGKVALTTVTSGVGISIHAKNQAGSDPGQGHEALARSNL